MNHIGIQMLSVIKLGKMLFRDPVVQQEDNLFIAVLQKQAWKLPPINDLAGRAAVSLLWFSKHGHSVWVVMFYVCERTVVNHLMKAEGESWAAGTGFCLTTSPNPPCILPHTNTDELFLTLALCTRKHGVHNLWGWGGCLFYFQLPRPSLDLPHKHKQQ